MNTTVQGMLTVAARMMIALIFLMSALGNKIPNFNGVAQYMGERRRPRAQGAARRRDCLPAGRQRAR